jgi:hypothetical protein
MATVRNDVIISQGLNKLLEKGSIDLAKLSAYLAEKSKARGGPNSSDIVTGFQQDRYERGGEKPTELKTPEAVETFVQFAATLDDQGFLGIGKNPNGDFAKLGSPQINPDSRLEQAFVDDLTTEVNGSLVFNDTDMANIGTDKAVVSEPAAPEQENDTVPVNPDTRQRTEEIAPKTKEKRDDINISRTLFTFVKKEISPRNNPLPGIAYIDTDGNGLSEPFEKRPDGTLVPIKPRQVIDYNGQTYTKMGDGSLSPITA